MTSMKIISVDAKDIRFPTSLKAHGSDAMHPDPDYSCAYVIVGTDTKFKGYGLSFTLGRGTEIVICAINALAPIIIGSQTDDIFNHFGIYWRKLTSDSQLRWLGPEKGVMHLAISAILNALWDLWARIEYKPLWKLLSDMQPEQLISTIDFRYTSDAISKEWAISILQENNNAKHERQELMNKTGYPAYTTQVGWIGYTDSKIRQLSRKFIMLGFRGFKVKVGANLETDHHRCKIIRDEIGESNYLMMDANQKWDLQEAINWMAELSIYKPLWIEEPTSPDDVLAHASISKGLRKYNIGVATGEMCSNRVMFKQFLQSGAMQFCQVDSCRLGSVNELLAVYLLAYKYNVPVCPHAGGVGLCQMVQHLQIFDYICLSKQIKPGQFIEYVDEEHEHFVTELYIRNGHYIAPADPGYGTEIKAETLQKYEYPNGDYWKNKTHAPS